MPDRVEALTEINLEDLMAAFGWQGRPRVAGLARAMFHSAAETFARQILDFDANIADRGLVEAARLAERHLARDVRVYGADRLPAGGFLAVANHPGLTDTLALFAALGRQDLRAIALDRPFLLSLVNISRRLFYLPEEPSSRVALVRQVARYLKAGGAVLTFPAGHNEPDPEVQPGAVDSLRTWMDSAGLFVRLAPGTPVVPVCVRGVTWAKAARHPLTRLRRSHDDQQLLASALQLLWQLTTRMRPITVRVQIGSPIFATQGGVTAAAADLHAAVLDAMKRLIEAPPDGPGASVLQAPT